MLCQYSNSTTLKHGAKMGGYMKNKFNTNNYSEIKGIVLFSETAMYILLEEQMGNFWIF